MDAEEMYYQLKHSIETGLFDDEELSDDGDEALAEACRVICGEAAWTPRTLPAVKKPERFAGMGMHVIMAGNPVDGFRIIGPFKTADHGVMWADRNVTEADWWTLPIEQAEEG